MKKTAGKGFHSVDRKKESQKGLYMKKKVIGIVCVAAGLAVLGTGLWLMKKSKEQETAMQVEIQSLQNGMESSEESKDEDNLNQVSSIEERKADSTEEAVVSKEGTQGNTDESAKENAQGTESGTKEGYVSPYATVFAQNEDMAAWLSIEGTVIDYPVMQTLEDENYYLKRGFDGKSNENGCLILDTDSQITEPISTNLIIHGHNMKSGAMFGTLPKYEDAEYCKEHQYIKLYTREEEKIYQVICVFRSQVYKKSDQVFKFYNFFQADTQEEFDDWYDNIKKLAEFDTGVTAQFGDHFLTLSTCVYHVENGRLVVVAKQIQE